MCIHILQVHALNRNWVLRRGEESARWKENYLKHHCEVAPIICRALCNDAISSSISSTICARKTCRSRSFDRKLVSPTALSPPRIRAVPSISASLESMISSSPRRVWVPSSLPDNCSIVSGRARRKLDARSPCFRFLCSNRLYCRLNPLLLRGHDNIGQV